MDRQGVASELYGLAPSEFTAARNARAKELRADGDRELAAWVQKLPKPSTAAWVVNLLVRRQAAQIDQLLDLGAQLREAQADLQGEELRRLDRERRKVTAAVTTQGRRLAHELGAKVSQAVADQVQETLHAAMSSESAAEAVRSGTLTDALSATGWGEVDVTASVVLTTPLGEAAAGASERVEEPISLDDRRQERAERRRREEERREAERLEAERRRQVAGAQRELDEAEQAFAHATAERDEAGHELDQTRERRAELEEQLQSLRAQLEQVQDELGTATDSARELERRHGSAARAAQRAEADVERARRRLEELQ
ncbi:MAG TPA: hypothetical protein VFL99_08570 [Segeticoccus sp.]|uniref:hypothetical protein n=1 Tax=Segeticoccus sp. TaxID=2706531 RepID=UPI002D7EE715|nr:hypothetical protein [Segeticoccus sp.]HET8600366.1 hypothetical protein [Segeticoccus sp.]